MMKAAKLFLLTQILSSLTATSRGQAAVCPSLSSPTAGSISYSNSTLGVGSLVFYNCDGTVRTCQSNGSWSGSTPNCEAFPCVDLFPILKGVASYSGGTIDNRPAGTRVTYSCDTGYTIDRGSSTRTCQSDRTWSGTAPTCAVISCGSPPSISSGSIRSATGTKFRERITYKCDSGYTLSGPAAIVCQANEKWENPPTCSLISCGSPPHVKNGSPGTPTSTLVGGTVTYSCDTGYQRLGPATVTVTCLASGRWSFRPACTVISCGPPPSIPNGSPGTPVSTTFGGTVVYSCDSGYVLSGSATVTCGASGSWSTRPSCVLPPVYLSLGSTNYTLNDSHVDIDSIGESDGWGLVCHTGNIECRRGVDDPSCGVGNWYYPNGSVVSEEGGLYVTRGDQTVSLNRRTSAQAPGGLYCCVVPTSASKYDTACIVLAPRSDSSTISRSYSSQTSAAVVVGYVAATVTVLFIVMGVLICLAFRYKRRLGLNQ